MDYNQAALSGYQSNKTLSSSRTEKDKIPAQAIKLKDTSASSSAQNLTQPDLKEGQLVKGQVIDLRYNEVKIQLEPGKQIVTAKLAGDVPLSIGQDAKFQVSEDSTHQIVLKYVPSDNEQLTSSTVTKVLTASNFPFTDRNKALVQELLNHRMPVDKATLQNLIRISLANREASPQTLVLMLKNNIPLTTANINQYETYQKGTNQIMKDLSTISESVSELLQRADSLQPEAEHSLSELPVNTATRSQADTSLPEFQKALQINNKIITILNHSTDSTNVTELPLRQFFTPKELMELSNSIEQKMNGISSFTLNQPADFLQRISEGELSLKDTEKLMKFIESTGQTTDPLIQKLNNQIIALEVNKPQMSDLLSKPERLNLLQSMETLPDTNNLKELISNGTANLRDVLRYLQENLTTSENGERIQLLQTPEYAKLLKEAFMHKWTITPEKVADKEKVNGLFEQLKEDLDQLTTLAGGSKVTEEMLRLQEPVKNLQDNLQFVKDLNEVFTYLPLPLKFKNQEAHAELYVMTRKKALREPNEGLSVLLHLDMTNLGSLNVHVKLNQEQLQATFYLEDKDARRLINENLPSLTNALQSKGYHIKTEVKENYQKPNFSKDFMEESSIDNNISRYTFDIRT